MEAGGMHDHHQLPGPIAGPYVGGDDPSCVIRRAVGDDFVRVATAG